MLNLINSGTEFYFPNILTRHSNFEEKLLATPLFHLIHLTMIQIHLMKIRTIDYVLVYMTNLSISVLFLHLHGFAMRLLHYLDTHVTF